MPQRWIELGTTADGKRIALPPKVRSTHMHVLGASGRGKSKLLEAMIRRDIINGEGLCLIDPHGYLYQDLLRWCETTGIQRKLLLFDPTAAGWTFGFNPLDFGTAGKEEVSFAVDSMVRAIAQVWGGEDTNRTPLLKRCLRAIIHALVEARLTLLEAQELATEGDVTAPVRQYIADQLRDEFFREQWRTFNALEPGEFREYFHSTNNRLTEFLASPIIRGIIGQTENVLDLAKCMDEGYIVLVNLASAGQVSDDNARLLGALLVNDLFLKARRRPPGSRAFYLYIDECSLFINEDIGRILDEGRKFGLHLILAHQHLAQLKRAGEAVYSAVMTNAQSKVVFGGLSPEDAPILAELLFMGDLDLEEPKHKLDKPVVTQYARTWMRNRSESESRSTGTSSAHSSSESETTSVRTSSDGEEEDSTYGSTSGSSETFGYSYSDTVTSAAGMSEALEPILTVLPTNVFSLQEQVYKATALVVNQPARRAIVKIPGRPSVQVKTPFVREGVARDERVEGFKKRAFESTPSALPRQVAEEKIRKRREELRVAARRKTTPQEPASFFE